MTKSDISTTSPVVLLVDDDDSIRITSETILVRNGFRVIVADSGPSAVDIFKRRHRDIDVVITDMIMPEMTGDEVFFEIRRIDAECPVVVSSGYMEQEVLDVLNANGVNGLIAKPFKSRQLCEVVRSVLRVPEE